LTLQTDALSLCSVMDDIDELLRELDALWEQGGDSHGAQWTREELHERGEAVSCEERKQARSKTSSEGKSADQSTR
jgi:hypothetical protein